MKFLPGGVFALVLSVGFAFGSEHSLILHFETEVDIEDVLNNYTLVSARDISGNPVYKVNISYDGTAAELINELDDLSGIISVEKNQKGDVNGRVSAADLDGRPLLVLDEGAYPSEMSLSAAATGETMYSQWFQLQVYADYVWAFNSGRNVKVAIVDSGVDMEHPFLVDNLCSLGYDFVDGDNDPSEERLGLDSNKNNVLDEAWGHGTHVAGIVRMIAPEALIMPIRVVDGDGMADLFDILAGLEYALENGAHVVNLSLSVAEESPLLRAWIRKAKRYNVVVVTSAGNNDSSQIQFPANEEDVITVTSIDDNYVKSSFANFGASVDVCAPGENILSAHPGGGYIRRSGTSMAAPIVAGQAALIRRWHPTANFHRIINRVDKTLSVDHLNPSHAGRLGSGLVNMVLGLN